MKINHDIKVRRAGHTITIWCKTHEEILYTHQGRSDIPLAEVLEAVANHRGTPHTAGAARIRRLPDGTYRFDLDDVNLSAAVVGGSNFVMHHTGDTGGPDQKMLTITILVDSLDVDPTEVRVVNAERTLHGSSYTYGLVAAPSDTTPRGAR